MLSYTQQTTKSIPTCIGVIMDGNRRWAKERNLPTLEGHRKGRDTFKQMAEWCMEAGVRHLVVYAFSTENWNRSEKEVSYLMDILRQFLHEQKETKRKEKVAVHMVGDLSRFPADIQKLIDELHANNPEDAEYHEWVAVSYGGRAEVVAAVNKLVQKGVPEVTEETFVQAFWTAGMPDPDIIIRTGGEKRLSNFLLWQSGYSELFFVDTLWPAFSKEDFLAILNEFAVRKRNFGI